MVNAQTAVPGVSLLHRSQMSLTPGLLGGVELRCGLKCVGDWQSGLSLMMKDVTGHHCVKRKWV